MKLDPSDLIIISGLVVSHSLLLSLMFLGLRVYRRFIKGLDPVALELRVRALETTAGSHTVTIGRLVSQIADSEGRIGDQLESLGLNQTKLLGHLTGTERLVAEMVKQYREVSSRGDQIQSQIASIASRVGRLEQ